MTTNITVQDAVFGEIVINDPLVIEIVSSPSMQRLKGIDMAGYSAGYYPGCRHTRFEHSIGVYHLLTVHNACIEERIHGLLHDLSHTAFSHAVDYALAGSSGARQDFQDRIFKNFVMKTDVPRLLRKHGLDPEFVLDEENFPLQEKPIPDLCADRLDYSFRGFLHYEVLSHAEISTFVDGLRSNGVDWYFVDQATARKYAQAFADIDDKVYDSLTGAAMFRSVGDCIKYALDQGVLEMDDLFSTDRIVLQKLECSAEADPHLAKLWARMNGKMRFQNDKEDFDAVVRCKSRIVDPLFMTSDGSLKKLSEEEPDWVPVVEQGLLPKTYHLKFMESQCPAP